MKITSENMISISQANKNFSKLTRIVDEKGYAVILKHNSIKYILMPYEKLEKEEISKNENIEEIAQRLIEKIKDEYNIQLKLDL